MSKEKARTITLELDPTVYSLLEVLTRGESAPVDSVEGVIYKLIDHAQQGVHRPGACEREWLTQAFGDDWMIEQLEPGDPYGRPATRNEYKKRGFRENPRRPFFFFSRRLPPTPNFTNQG